MVLRRARTQHGVVTARQLAAAGLGRHGTAHRVAKGWLTRLHHGVYLVGPLETVWSQAMAAVLAYGDGALLSHATAAVLWGIHEPANALHVTVIGRDVRRRAGITAHTTDHLHPADATTRHGIPTSSPARTLLDLATTATPTELDRAVNEARVNHLTSDSSLSEQFRRYPTHRGAARLRAALDTDPTLTRSEAERRMLELIRAARLPRPQANASAEGHEVDLVWRSARLVAEIDGYAFHSSRRAFERDRRRDADLVAAGYRVLRVTWRQLVEEPEAVVARLATALAAYTRG